MIVGWYLILRFTFGPGVWTDGDIFEFDNSGRSAWLMLVGIRAGATVALES